MNIESGICGNLLTVFQAIFPGLEVDCKWLVGRNFMPVHRPRETKRMTIDLSPRKHESYTTRVAEFSGTVAMAFALSDESDVVRTIEAYDQVVEKIDAWHHDIEEAKRDLSIQGASVTSDTEVCPPAFTPVGFMSNGGTLDIDRENKTSNFTIEFTLKGRKAS